MKLHVSMDKYLKKREFKDIMMWLCCVVTGMTSGVLNAQNSADRQLDSLLYASKEQQKQGQFQKALRGYQAYVKFRDSVFNVKTTNEMTRKTLQFEYDRKESEYRLNEQLNKQFLSNKDRELELSRNQILLNFSELSLKNSELELQEVEQQRTEAELKRRSIQAQSEITENKFKKSQIEMLAKQQRLQKGSMNARTNERNAFIMGFLLLGLTLFFVFYDYRNQRRSNTIIAARNRELNSTLRSLQKTQHQLIQAENEKRLAIEKTRIARDIHDELGSGLTKISILGELLKNDAGEHAVQINEISETAGSLVDNLSQIVWSMNPENDKLLNLFGYVRKYSLDFFENSAVHCRVVLPDELRNIHLTQSLRRNLFLVIRDHLRQVLDASDAESVEISAERTGDSIRIIIADNGGRKAIMETPGAANKMAIIGGRFELKWSQGQGACCVVEWPVHESDKNMIEL